MLSALSAILLAAYPTIAEHCSMALEKVLFLGGIFSEILDLGDELTLTFEKFPEIVNLHSGRFEDFLKNLISCKLLVMFSVEC